MEKPYQFSEELIEYVKKKLGLSDEGFHEILHAEKKTFEDYPTYYPLIKSMKIPVKVASQLGLIEPLIYHKYFP